MNKVTFAGLDIVWDEATPSDTMYLIGPKAIENLQASPALDGDGSAYDEWVREGRLKYVKLTGI